MFYRLKIMNIFFINSVPHQKKKLTGCLLIIIICILDNSITYMHSINNKNYIEDLEKKIHGTQYYPYGIF